jgi:hypothetical protein
LAYFEIHPEYSSSWRSAFAIFGRAVFVYELGSRASTQISELSATFFSFHVDQSMPRGGGAYVILPFAQLAGQLRFSFRLSPKGFLLVTIFKFSSVML